MQNQQQGAVPNVVGNRAGWYPRWWLLAALCCCLIIVAGMLLWTPVICPGRPQQQPFICGVTGLYPPVQVLLIWGLLLGFWVPIAIFGVRLVEIPRPEANPIGSLLDQITRFDSLSSMLYIQGLVALVLINVLWWLNNSPSIAFALLGIVVFLAHCNFFYRVDPGERRVYAIGYGVTALLNLVAQWLFRRNFWPPSNAQEPLVYTEFLLIMIGIIAIFYRPRPTQQAAQQTRNTLINQAASPSGILRSMWPLNRIIPQRPPRVQQAPPANQANSGPLGNPDPGAP